MLSDKGMSLYPYIVVYIKWVSLQERHLPGRQLQQLLFTFDEGKMRCPRGVKGSHAHTNGCRWDTRENCDIEHFWEEQGERCRVRYAFVKSIKTLVSWCEETEEKSFGFSINHRIHRDEVRNEILLFFLRLLLWNDWRLLSPSAIWEDAVLYGVFSWKHKALKRAKNSPKKSLVILHVIHREPLYQTLLSLSLYTSRPSDYLTILLSLFISIWNWLRRTDGIFFPPNRIMMLRTCKSSKILSSPAVTTIRMAK